MRIIFLCFIILVFSEFLSAEEIKVQVKGLKIAGTLEMPAAKEPVPLAIMIAGSGPTDRDGNSAGSPGKNNCLKQLSEKLLIHKVASFRYDKRMIGRSIGKIYFKEKDARLEDFVGDAVECIEYFRKDKRFSKIFIIGHSEGSLIGILAALRTKAEGFISIAGIGRPAYESLSEQLSTSGAPLEILNQCTMIIDSLKSGKIVNKVNPLLNPLFRPGVQPFLISMFRYDPAAEISKLDIPVLILHGTMDIQVSQVEAEILNKSARHSTLKIIEGMNHVMKPAAEKNRMAQIKSYYDPALEIPGELVDSIAEYITVTLP